MNWFIFVILTAIILFNSSDSGILDDRNIVFILSDVWASNI